MMLVITRLLIELGMQVKIVAAGASNTKKRRNLFHILPYYMERISLIFIAI